MFGGKLPKKHLWTNVGPQAVCSGWPAPHLISLFLSHVQSSHSPQRFRKLCGSGMHTSVMVLLPFPQSVDGTGGNLQALNVFPLLFSLAEKAHHQPAVTSPTSIFGALAWKMFKVPYCVYFVLPSTILVTGSLTLGNCPISQGKLLCGRSGHIWISAVKGIYCWARSRKLQSLFLSFITSDLDVNYIPLLLLYFSSFQTLRHHQTAETITFQ